MTTFNRIRVDSDADNSLRQLKANTGLTPNYLCRLGLCYSLNAPRTPNPGKYDTEGREINRYTLLGEHDPLYIALVKERLIEDGLDPEKDLYGHFMAHLNRGVIRLSNVIRGLTDLYEVLPQEMQASLKEEDLER